MHTPRILIFFEKIVWDTNRHQLPERSLFLVTKVGKWYVSRCIRNSQFWGKISGKDGVAYKGEGGKQQKNQSFTRRQQSISGIRTRSCYQHNIVQHEINCGKWNELWKRSIFWALHSISIWIWNILTNFWVSFLDLIGSYKFYYEVCYVDKYSDV